MRTRNMLETISALLVAAAAWMPALASAADEAPIRKLQVDFAAAWNKHDAKAVAGYWAADGDVITPDGKPWHGRAEIERFFAGGYTSFFKDTTFSVTVNAIRFIEPDIAIVDCSYQVAGEKDATGKDVTEKGLYTAVETKKDGKWWIVAARPMIPVAGAPTPAEPMTYMNPKAAKGAGGGK